MLGMWLQRVLPPHHLDTRSKDTIRVGIGLISTITALVLGLVTASAKSSFDAADAAVEQSATNILALDRTLARYGSETNEIRRALQHALRARIDTIWPQDSSKPIDLDPMRAVTGRAAEGIAGAIHGLRPRDDSQRELRLRALELAETMLRARWLSVAAAEKSVSVPFLLILVLWLTVTFASFGLFAPRNATVLAVLFVCATVRRERRVSLAGAGYAIRRRAQGVGGAAALRACASQPVGPLSAISRPQGAEPHQGARQTGR